MDKSIYKNVCVFIEQRDGNIQPVALELLGKAKQLADELNEKVVALFPGHNISNQAQMLIEYGADEVICIDEPELKDYLTEQYSQAMDQAIQKFKPSIVLIGATTIGRDLGPQTFCKSCNWLNGRLYSPRNFGRKRANDDSSCVWRKLDGHYYVYRSSSTNVYSSPWCNAKSRSPNG